MPLYSVVGEKEIGNRSLSFMCRKDGGLVDLGEIPLDDAIGAMEQATKNSVAAVDEAMPGGGK